MLRLAFDFIIAWRETRTRPNAYVLIGVLSPRLLRKISGAMLRIIDGAGVSHFEPREDSYVQIIIECVFYLIGGEILQWDKMQHIPARHKCLVSLHLGSRGMKKSRCAI